MSAGLCLREKGVARWGLCKARLRAVEGRRTYDRKVDLPHPGSPNSKIDTSLTSSMSRILHQHMTRIEG